MSRSTPAHSPQGNTWTEMSWAKRKRKYLNEKENHHTWKPSLFWSQPTGIVYLFIYSCWFCWTRCCVPSKTDSKYSIFNNDIDLSSINMYLYAQVYYSFVLWERVGKKNFGWRWYTRQMNTWSTEIPQDENCISLPLSMLSDFHWALYVTFVHSTRCRAANNTFMFPAAASEIFILSLGRQSRHPHVPLPRQMDNDRSNRCAGQCCLWWRVSWRSFRLFPEE